MGVRWLELLHAIRILLRWGFMQSSIEKSKLCILTIGSNLNNGPNYKRIRISALSWIPS